MLGMGVVGGQGSSTAASTPRCGRVGAALEGCWAGLAQSAEKGWGQVIGVSTVGRVSEMAPARLDQPGRREMKKKKKEEEKGVW